MNIQNQTNKTNLNNYMEDQKMKKLSFSMLFLRRKKLGEFLSQLQFYPLTLFSIVVIGFILLAYGDNPWPINGLVAYVVLAILCTIGASVAHYEMVARLINNEKTNSSFGVNFAFIAVFMTLTAFAWPIVALSVVLIVVDMLDKRDARKTGANKAAR